MKNKPKRKPKPTAISAERLLAAPLVVPATRVLNGMISNLEGMLGGFDQAVHAQVKRLIRLTTALRNKASADASGEGASRRPKRRRKR